METSNKTCHSNLLCRIEELKILKLEQEQKIKYQYSDLKDSLSFGSLIKESISHITESKETQRDLLKIATTTGTNYLIEKVLGSNSSIKRYLGSLLAEKVSSSFIGKLIAKI
ncbi:hypothetical protein [Flavobacterium sp. 25HG05S-40]|uniref:hypothetical protein n=1 Tax=Flavobacterium sp. 25HG05S-40 TaxID=3458682 RepID=UPI0040441C89